MKRPSLRKGRRYSQINTIRRVFGSSHTALVQII